MKNYPYALVELRSKLKISQEELAKILGVSFSSVNRWENGHFEPTKIIKFRVDKLLEEHGIEVKDDENKIVGDCELRINSQTKTRHRSQIGIALLKKYQNLGIGSFLFDEMINLAKSTDGIEQIELDVVSTNDLAKHLYAKKGFVKTGTIPRQLKQSDGTYSDGEMMTLFLK